MAGMGNGGQILAATRDAYQGDASLFIAAAHDLKSPLALLRQLALHIEGGGLSPSEIATTARRIVLTSERALRLTTDVTRSTHLGGVAAATIAPLNLTVLCRDIATEIQPLYRANDRHITVHIPRRSMIGLADRELLGRIVLNFVDNALHYSRPDTPVVITISRRQRGRVIRLAVRDHGPAVPAKLWQRLHHTIGVRVQPLHNRPGSSGLGLYIAGQFAARMRARIGAIRHRDGATFYVDIPAVHQQRLL